MKPGATAVTTTSESAPVAVIENGLTETHLAEFHASAIPDDLIIEAGVRFITDDEAHDLGLRHSGSLHGLLFPYLNVVEGGWSKRFARLKPDVHTGDRKYLQPVGERPRLYFVPGTTASHLRDTHQPILIVEGEKKALALEGWRRRQEASYQIIGIGGADAWLRAVKELRPDGSLGKVRSTPIDDLDLINWQGRPVVLCFDGDVTTNIGVMWAESRLAKELRRRGANVSCIRIPPDAAGVRRGADDVLAGAGDVAWEEILASARPHEGRPLESDRHEAYAYGDGVFRLSTDGYEKLKKDKDGEEWFRVTNFTITIDEILRPIDREASTLFRGYLHVAGRPPRPIVLDAKTLADTTSFRTAVYKTSLGLDFPSRLSAVVAMLTQRLGNPPLEKTAVMSVGLHDGRFVFPSVIIEDGDIRENTDWEVLNSDKDVLMYDLPCLPAWRVKEVAEFVLSAVLPLHQPAVMLPLLGCVGLAPIQHLFEKTGFAAYFGGTTGAGKTLVLKIAANFFANIPLSAGLPSVTSTINALEFTGYHLPGLPFFVDDVKRQWLERHGADFSRLLQDTYDRHGRGRLNRPATEKHHGYYVRGLLMVSGEDFPSGVTSAVERTLQITVPKGGLTSDFQERIALIDARREDLRGLMAHYIAWTQRLLDAEPFTLWDDAEFVPQEPRIRPYCQQLLSGLHYFFRFLQEEGGISGDFLDRQFEAAVTCLEQIASATRRDANEQRDEDILLDGVRELLASGVCRLLKRHVKVPDADGVVVGEEDNDVVYLLPAIAIQQIQRLRGVVLNTKSVGQALKERGHLARLGEGGRPQANARINGKVTRVFVLKADVLFPQEEG